MISRNSKIFQILLPNEFVAFQLKLSRVREALLTMRFFESDSLNKLFISSPVYELLIHGLYEMAKNAWDKKASILRINLNITHDEIKCSVKDFSSNQGFPTDFFGAKSPMQPLDYYQVMAQVGTETGKVTTKKKNELSSHQKEISGGSGLGLGFARKYMDQATDGKGALVISNYYAEGEIKGTIVTFKCPHMAKKITYQQLIASEERTWEGHEAVNKKILGKLAKRDAKDNASHETEITSFDVDAEEKTITTTLVIITSNDSDNDSEADEESPTSERMTKEEDLTVDLLSPNSSISSDEIPMDDIASPSPSFAASFFALASPKDFSNAEEAPFVGKKRKHKS